MRNFSIFILAIIALASCNKEENLMHITGEIKGLKKGKLYLQHIADSVLVNIDSVTFDGNNNFDFSVPLESPEVFYLYLDKNDGNDVNDRITLFGEVGEINVQTFWNAFEPDAVITGSAANEKFVEYREIMSKFNTKNLEYLQSKFEAQIDSSYAKMDSIQKLLDKNVLRGYLYTLNFALNNKDSHVAPYIALSEAFDAKIKYLDTIYNSLTPEVANSKYGKQLSAYLEKIKVEEASNTEE